MKLNANGLVAAAAAVAALTRLLRLALRQDIVRATSLRNAASLFGHSWTVLLVRRACSCNSARTS